MTRPRKTTGMWGLDFAEGRLRLVHIHGDRGRLRLTRAVTVRVGPEAGDEQVADLLRRVVVGSGVATENVAICLPATAGYVVCESPAEPSGASRTPQEPFITGRWTAGGRGDSLIVSGVANRQAADRAVRVGRLAGLHVSHVALPQVAIAAALGLLDANDGSGVRAGFAVGSAHVHFAVARSCALLASRSTPRAAGGEGGEADVPDAATQMYRAVQMSGSAPLPSTCGIIADGESDSLIEKLSARLGVDLHRLRAGGSAALTCADDVSGDLGDYAAAIGSVLVARGATAVRMDLLGALNQGEVRKPLVRKGFLITVFAVFALVLGGVFLVEQINKRRILAELEQQYHLLSPLLERQRQSRETWERIRPWLGSDQGGHRVEHLKILESLTEVFPDAADAYVTDMDMAVGQDAPEKNVSVNLKGRAADTEILYGCVSRLHELSRFKARLGRVSDVEQAQVYPKTYEVSIIINPADTDGESK